MIDKTKKNNKKGFVSEEDISTLLQRYKATTVLALLQEVAQFEGTGKNIDWNALAKKTKTGISNPREFQMLWRHLAYRHSLLDNLQDGAQPLDDDSDLEYEVEAFPDVPSEASAEAAACVKVLMASGLSRDSSHPNNAMVEAPLIINIPNGQSCRPTSDISQPTVMHGMNITVPVSVQKQSLPAVNSAEGLDTNRPAGGTIPPRRKRKLWSEAEDIELIAAVQKFGEGNWANILRGEFKGDRTASQLSQRWSIIRKKQSNLNPGANSGGLQLSEEQQATRHAINLALDPLSKNFIKNSSGGATVNNTLKNTVPPTATAETLVAQHQSQRHPILTKSIIPSVSTAKSLEDSSALRTNGGTTLNGTSLNSVLSTTAAKASPAQLQSQQCPIMTKSSAGPFSSATLKKPSLKADLSSDPVRAAAVAAGARIATQSDAVSLLKAAQAKNAVHIMPTGGSLMKPSICGLAATPLSSGSAVLSNGSHAALTKPSSSEILATPLTSGKTLSSKQTNAELSERQDAKHEEGKKISGSEDVEKELVKEDEACALANEPSEVAKKSEGGVHLVKDSEEALRTQETEFESQAVVAESSNSPMKMEMSGSDMADVNGDKGEESKNANAGKTRDLPIEELEFQSTVQENGKFQSIGDQQTNLQSMKSDECGKTLLCVNKEEPCNGTS